MPIIGNISGAKDARAGPKVRCEIETCRLPAAFNRKSLKDHGPCCTGARYSQDVASAFGRLVIPIATPGLHNPDAGSSLDPLADQYALERGLLRPTTIIPPRL